MWQIKDIDDDDNDDYDLNQQVIDLEIDSSFYLDSTLW